MSMAQQPSDAEVRVVVFDWGGVILRIVRDFAEALSRAGLPLRDEPMHPEARKARSALAQRYQRGELECDVFFAQLSQATAGLYSPDELRLVHRAWLIEEYPGVRALVEDLRRVPGVETALLSNTNAGHWSRHLPGPGGTAPDFPTIGLLHHRVASHLVRAAKPEEAIYRAIENVTGARGEQIVFFDDLEENIAAARGLGWRAVQIDHTGDTAAQMRERLGGLGVLREASSRL